MEALVEGFLVDVEKNDADVMDLKSFTFPKTGSALEELATGTDTQVAKDSTNKFRFVRSAVLLPEEEGSGSGLNPGFDRPDFNEFTTRSSTVEPADDKPSENANEEVLMVDEAQKQGTSSTGKDLNIFYHIM